MHRRLALSTAAAWMATCPGLSIAQTPHAPMPRVGVLLFGPPPSGADPDPMTGLSQSLADLGFVDGRNVLIDYRFAGGRPELLRAQAAELVQLRSSVIVAGGPAPLQVLREATKSIPIVSIGGSDPVQEGWAQTLARPGGNVTGVTVTFPELGPKQLELLKQVGPDLQRVGVLTTLTDPGWAGMEDGARGLGLELIRLHVSGPAEFDAVFKTAMGQGMQALYAIATNTIVSQRTRLAELAIGFRVPSISELTLLADAGFLMSYGADLNALGRRAASFVDKILKGARPSEMPIERPSDFELVINRKTAAALGISFPTAIEFRANRVIG
jgi:putative ABC transport system substrate-binding protein